MSFLTLNGIAVPVLLGSATQDSEELGPSERTADATLISHRYAFKEGWPFHAKHSDGATAFAFRELVRGSGNAWDFEGASLGEALYSARGVPLVASGGDVEHYSLLAKYGSKSLFLGDGTYAQNTILLTGLAAWSVHAWVFAGAIDDGAWHHYLVRSDGAKWVDGVRNDAFDVTWWLSTTSTTFKLLAAGYDLPFDDVAVLPYLVPTTWPAQFYAAGAAFGPLPNLRAAGDFVEFGQQSAIVKGEVEGAEAVRAASGSRWVLKGKLKQV